MRRSTPLLLTCLLLIVGTLPGCFVMQIGVSNPAPNLPRVGVAPFVNLSTERSVDGRRFAEAYYTELQKVPGFQVIPVGVVESAMHDYKLNLDSPKDIEKLIDILDIDSLCFGAITEYNPYYPPRLGLQISWYTTHVPNFQPGLPLDPGARKWYKKAMRSSGKGESWSDQLKSCWPGSSSGAPAGETSPMSPPCAVVRGQNETEPQATAPLSAADQQAWEQALQAVMFAEAAPASSPLPSHKVTPTNSLQQANHQPPEIPAPAPLAAPQMPPSADPFFTPPPFSAQPLPNSPLAQPAESRGLLPGENPDPASPFPQPYMSYTRVFDGADADFTAALRNYLELSGDQRSGGWTGHLHRSEDFIRFCMHRMILEMLQLHGGESQRRFVMTSRKYQ